MSQTNLTVVLKATNELQKKIIDFYKEEALDKVPPYAIFSAKTDDCVITLYQSGKLMFQGKRAEEESAIWSSLGLADAQKKSSVKSESGQAKALLAGEKTKSQAGGFLDTTSVGSDEVGTGDYFGPVVVTASFVPEEKFSWMVGLGVRDSKKLTDEKIRQIAPKLMENILHKTQVLDNDTYNDLRDEGVNLNVMKARMHNACLGEVLKNDEAKTSLVVVDQFEPEAAYYRHLNDQQSVISGITFMTKAEDKCLSVAASSIISRYVFLQEVKAMQEKYGLKEEIPLGAGAGVDAYGAEILKERGEDFLRHIAKLHFANTEKIKSMI